MSLTCFELRWFIHREKVVYAIWYGLHFPHLPRTALGPTQPTVRWLPGLSRGKESQGSEADPSPLLVSWSWKGRSIPLLPLWAVQPVQSLSACTRVHFTFTFRNLPNKWITFSVLCLFWRFGGTYRPRLQGDAEVKGYKKICGLWRIVKEIWLVTAGRGRGDRICSESMGAENSESAKPFQSL